MPDVVLLFTFDATCDVLQVEINFFAECRASAWIGGASRYNARMSASRFVIISYLHKVFPDFGRHCATDISLYSAMSVSD